MKRILLYLLLWLTVFIANGCVTVRYPDEYWGWSDDRRSEWREQHPLRWNERYENRREQERFEGRQREEGFGEHHGGERFEERHEEHHD